MADNVGGQITVPDISRGEFANAVANVIYNSIPWSRAGRSRLLSALKIGAMGVKGLTPEARAFATQDERLRNVVDHLNALNEAIQGVDVEDLLKAIYARYTIQELKRYVFGGKRGGIMLTRTFFPDP